MASYSFVTLDVFTDRLFGGNPLAVFLDGRGLTAAEMQALAREFNLSETSFILPPDDPHHTARVRIFDPASELPFAGHPLVGTGFVLAGRQGGRADRLTLEVPAGLVEVAALRGPDGALQGGVITAPLPLALGDALPAEAVAACASLAAADLLTLRHPPRILSMGAEFVVAETHLAALQRARPDLAAFHRLAERCARPALHLYARDGAVTRSRMFAPLAGINEDPATGSANAPLGALLLSLSGAESDEYDIWQGIEMGRPSRLRVKAWRDGGVIRASVGGGCVPVMQGSVTLPDAGGDEGPMKTRPRA